MSFFYTAFGLRFSSALELPELASETKPGTPDVEIISGRIEAALNAPVTSGLFFQASQSECILTAPEGSRYWISYGKKIMIEPAPASSMDVVRYFLIYGALPMLLIQRGIFLLHGSAVSDGKQALVLLGASRSGKSTLAAGFWQRGWRLVSDELIVCTLDSAQRVCVQPGIPRILLWQNTLDQLKLNSELVKPARIPNQFILNVGEKFAQKPIPVQAIFYLERKHNVEINQPDVLQGHARFLRILQQVYLPRFPRHQSVGMEQAQIPIKMAGAVPLNQISWSSREHYMDDLLNKILEQVK